MTIPEEFDEAWAIKTYCGELANKINNPDFVRQNLEDRGLIFRDGDRYRTFDGRDAVLATPELLKQSNMSYFLKKQPVPESTENATSFFNELKKNGDAVLGQLLRGEN